MKNKIINYILCKCLYYFNKKYLFRIESSVFKETKLRNFFRDNDFVKNNDGWYVRGFVYVRILNDCCEIKTIDMNADYTYLVSLTDESFKRYLIYLKKYL